MSADDPRKLDASKLSLAQLQRLAVRGSRRARAELERRMTEADVRYRAAPAPRLATAASLDQMAVQASSAASGAPGMAFPGNHETLPQISRDAQILHLQALAQQDEARTRAEGPPGLTGLALMVWGVLLLCGGLVLFTRKGGLYYILFGLACAAIGWLLLRCKRAALWVHAACVVAALLWAWRGYAGSTAASALIQSAPVWLAALWIAVPSVREPLD